MVFAGHNAFVGSGRRLQRSHILVDVSRGLKDKDGNRKKPKPFTSQDLHTALVRAFGESVGLGMRLDNVSAYERLFVNGRHVQNDERLRPEPGKPPETKVSPALLVESALRPTPEARTYVCVEMTGWEGQLVVTLFVRSVRVGDSLYIEWEFRVLPPLNKVFLAIDRLFEVRWHYQLGESLRVGMTEVLGELLAAPFRVLGAWHRPALVKRAENDHANEIRNGRAFDYGARRSIREIACGSERHHHFLERDEIMYVLLAQKTLSEAVVGFLDKHDVDQGEFDEQVSVIINDTRNTYNTEITVSDSTGVVVGNNSKASVNDKQRGAK